MKGNAGLPGGEGEDYRSGSGGDRRFGNNDADELAGGADDDTLAGGGGADVFIIEGDGSLDTFNDFTPLEDRIQLANGLSFDDLAIARGSGNNANNTVIRDGTTGLPLAILPSVSPPSLTAEHFF